MTIHMHVLGCLFCDEEALGSACSVVFFGFPCAYPRNFIQIGWLIYAYVVSCCNLEGLQGYYCFSCKIWLVVLGKENVVGVDR